MPREKAQQVSHYTDDEESQAKNGSASDDGAGKKNTEPKAELIRNTSVFTWKNLNYTVSTPQGDRQLLNNVQGWVKPGMLGALMGSSGAGKTTLWRNRSLCFTTSRFWSL